MASSTARLASSRATRAAVTVAGWGPTLGPGHMDAHRAAALVACDGAPMVWASRWAGVEIHNRVTGRDFMLACTARAAREGWTSFFYGGKPGVADALADSLRERFPTLQVAGTFTPPFGATTADEDEVRESPAEEALEEREIPPVDHGYSPDGAVQTSPAAKFTRRYFGPVGLWSASSTWYVVKIGPSARSKSSSTESFSIARPSTVSVSK